MPIANHEKWSYIHSSQEIRQRYTAALLLGTDFSVTADRRLAITNIYVGEDYVALNGCEACYMRISIGACLDLRNRLCNNEQERSAAR